MKRSAARGSEESVEVKRADFLQEKREIAKYICNNILQSGQTIYLDAGTSTYEMIEYLRGRRITVVTNSTYHLQKLINNKNSYNNIRWNDKTFYTSCYRSGRY